MTTPCYIGTVMGTSSIASETLINICNNSTNEFSYFALNAETIKVCSPLQALSSNS